MRSDLPLATAVFGTHNVSARFEFVAEIWRSNHEQTIADPNDNLTY
jgi:hypothetical protein